MKHLVIPSALLALSIAPAFVGKATIMHWIDPDCLPETRGLVEGFIADRHGQIDGVLLSGARETPLVICTPPHLAAEIEAAVQIGDTISVRGIRPRHADIIAAVALNPSSGRTIIDNGPADDEREAHLDGAKPSRMGAEGVVRLSLFGPKGELRGALLTDGTVVRIGPQEAASLAELLRPGALIALCGDGLQTKHGRVIAADEIGPDNRSLKAVKAPKHKEPESKKKHEGAEAVRPSVVST